jgi:outer membrane protein
MQGGLILKRILSAGLCLIFFLYLSLEVRPQSNTQTQLKTTPYQTPTKTEQVSMRRAAASGTLNLTLPDAVRMAVENNPALTVEKIRLEQSRSRINEQKGDFNYLFNASSSMSRRDNIVASRFYPAGFYLDDQKGANLGVERKTHTGGKLSLTLSYADLRSTSNTQTLSPQFSSSLVLNFTHALLRDFGRTTVESRLRVAEKGAAIAESNLFSKVSQMIQRVEESYWNLTFLLKDLEGKKRSLESAREFLTQNENLLRAGRVAQVAVTQSRAAVAERERDVITSQTSADQYEDRLKSLLWLDFSTTHVTPAQDAEEQPPLLDAERSLDTALQRRPEVLGLQRELESREIELKFAGNQKRPRLDLNAQYGQSGLSGKPNPTCIDPTSTLCIPVGSNIPGSILEGRTAVRDTFNTVFSNNPFENWSVELKFQMPLGNDAAKAQYDEAYLRRLETNANLMAMRDQVSMEIRAAVREAQASQKRIDASHEALMYVEDQLQGMRQQLDAGLVSSYDVLKAFDEVDKARTTELQAMMDLNVAYSKVRLAEASGFFRYNIELAQAPRYTFEPASFVR